MRLAVVIVNYRTPQLVADCLTSLATELDPTQDGVIVVDNHSGDESAVRIRQIVVDQNWEQWVQIIESPVNGGFSAGNNLGIQAVVAEAYLLLNSDTLVRTGAISALLEARDQYPEAGIISPRLEWPDTTPQISCFRYRSPLSEFIHAAGTGPITQLFKPYDVPLPVSETWINPEWTSFACVLIRREVIEQIGLMDEGYFMYFDDLDYCRQVRAGGWSILHYPKARVVHLRGGSSSVKAALETRTRPRRYLYESRSRYFGKYYGGSKGIFAANVLWLMGRSIAWVREVVQQRPRHSCDFESQDIWIQWRHPLRSSPVKAETTSKVTDDSKPIQLKRPHFIIIGAMKCATSTLHEQLACQPGILMSTPKEPNFFSSIEDYSKGLANYQHLFATATDQDLCGESSTHYTKLPTYPGTAKRIHGHLPDVKLIYVIRHPIDRLVSQYIHEWSTREIVIPINEAIVQHPRLIHYSLYAKQLQPFLQLFKTDQILVLFFESLGARPQVELERVCQFIGYSRQPTWNQELAQQNLSSQRLRTSKVRDLLVEAPVLRSIRRHIVPQAWRNQVKQLWLLNHRPELSPDHLADLQTQFDADLKQLGTWCNLDLTCKTFKQVALNTFPLWNITNVQRSRG